MSWQTLRGHQQVVERFRRSVARGRLASTFLFVGPHGIGKRRFALELAQALLCSGSPPDSLDACGTCFGCRQVAAQTHPDLLLISRPKEKSFIPVETFIGDGEHRMQEGMCHDIALKPMYGGRRVAVIDDADYLNDAGANCLLKTLEEPPPKSVMILLASSEQSQLPTIRSRCQIVRFAPLAMQDVADLLVAQGVVDDARIAAELAQLAEGSMEKAIELAAGDLREFREQLLNWLAATSLLAPALGKLVGDFVNEAGKDAPPRRARLNQIASVAAEFYRQLARRLTGAEIAGDVVQRRAVETAAAQWPGDAEAAVACLERCLLAATQVDSNANQNTLIECWLDDLDRLAHGERASTILRV